MKKQLKGLFVLLFMFACIFAFGCGDEPDPAPTPKGDPVPTAIAIDEQSITDAKADGIFDYHELTFTVTYDDGSTTSINLSDDMLTEEELAKFNKGGANITVNVTYGELSTSFTTKLPATSIKLIEVDADSVLAAYAEDTFDYRNIILKKTNSLAKVTEVNLDANMMSYSDLALLYMEGEHTITVTSDRCTTEFTVNNASSLYKNAVDLESYEDGTMVAVKGYVTFFTTNTIYFHSEHGGSYAVSTNDIVKSAKKDNVLADNNEVIMVGTKNSDGSLSILKNVLGMAKTTNKFNPEQTAVIDSKNALDTNLYSYVDFENAVFVSKDNILNPKRDTILVVSDGLNEFNVVLQSSLGDKYLNKVFVPIDDMAPGHVLVLEELVPAVYKGNTVLLATEKSNINFISQADEYHAPVEGEKNLEFEEYLDELFLDLLGDSPFNLNFQILDLKAFDEAHGTDLYNAPVVPSDPADQTPESELEYFDEVKEVIQELEGFLDATLSYSQRLDLKVLLDYFNMQLKYLKLDETTGKNIFYYYGTSLGSYLGYQAQLPSILSDYRFDDKKDIDNYLEYLRTLKSDFEVLYDFELSKIEAGEGNQLADYVVNLIIEQCDDFINAGEENYLITAFEERIGDYDFLTPDEVEEYKRLNREGIEDYFVPGYVWLREKMVEYKDLNNDSIAGALWKTEHGIEYYELMFQDACGSDMTLDELKAYIKNKMGAANIVGQNFSAYSGNLMKDTGLIKYKDGNKIDYYPSLYGVIPFLQEAVLDDFPDLGLIYTVGENIKINEIPDSLKDHSSPAYYLNSPIDVRTTELIYVNPNDFGDVNSYMYQTLAHEGWPGHLFQNVYYKSHTNSHDIRKIISYSSYSEGWANYVENYVVKYATDNYGYRQLALLTPASSLSSSEIDIGVNCEQWDVLDIIEAYGLTIDDVNSGRYQWSNGDKVSYDDFEEIYYTYCDVPTNYLMYNFSTCQLLDIKAEFKQAMGVYYSDKVFHQLVLETGECSWKILREVCMDYAAKWGTNGTER